MISERKVSPNPLQSLFQAMIQPWIIKGIHGTFEALFRRTLGRDMNHTENERQESTSRFSDLDESSEENSTEVGFGSYNRPATVNRHVEMLNSPGMLDVDD